MTIPWTTLAITKEDEADDGDNLYDFDNYEEGEGEGDDDEEEGEDCEETWTHPWTLVTSWTESSDEETMLTIKLLSHCSACYLVAVSIRKDVVMIQYQEGEPGLPKNQSPLLETTR